MKEFHIASEDGKNAKVGISRAKSNRIKIQLYSKTGAEIENVRVHNGKVNVSDAMSAKELIEGDPEVDLTNIGLILENGSRAFTKEGEDKIQGGFKLTDVIYNPDGTEKERRDHVYRKANINDTFPVKMGKRMPLKAALTQFVFCQHYALFHEDGLKYEFLFNLAKSLHDKQEVALLGAGPKGNQPMIFINGGSPYRGFLFGEIKGDKYRLLVMLSKQELKNPEIRKIKEEETQQTTSQIIDL